MQDDSKQPPPRRPSADIINNTSMHVDEALLVNQSNQQQRVYPRSGLDPTMSFPNSMTPTLSPLMMQQSLNHFRNQSMNQSMNQSLNQSLNPLISQSMNSNQSVHPLMNQTLNPSMSPIVNLPPALNQTINQSSMPSLDQAMNIDAASFNLAGTVSGRRQSIVQQLGNYQLNQSFNQSQQYFNPTAEQDHQSYNHDVQVKQQYPIIHNPAVIALGHAFNLLNNQPNNQSHHSHMQPSASSQPIRHHNRSPSVKISPSLVHSPVDADPFTESVNRAIPPFLSFHGTPESNTNQSVPQSAKQEISSQLLSLGATRSSHTPYPNHPPVHQYSSRLPVQYHPYPSQFLRRASAPNFAPARSTSQPIHSRETVLQPNSVMHGPPLFHMTPAAPGISPISSTPGTPMRSITTDASEAEPVGLAASGLFNYRLPLSNIHVKRVTRTSLTTEEKSSDGVGVNYQQRFNASITLPRGMFTTESSIRGRLIVTAKAIPVVMNPADTRSEFVPSSPLSQNEMLDAQDRDLAHQIYDLRPYFSITFIPNTRGGFGYGSGMWNGTVECNPPCKSLSIDCIIARECQQIEFTGTMERPDAMYNKRRELWNPVELQIEWVPDAQDGQAAVPVCAWVTLIRGSRRIASAG